MKSNKIECQTKKRNWRITKKIVLGLSLFLLLSLLSCNNKKGQNDPEIQAKEITVKKPISDMSIYNLPSQWTNQDGETIQMEDLKGKVLVMVMIYTSCKSACPRLVADMRNIESRLPENNKDNVRLVLVSIDPAVDTPERLKSFSIENKMEGNQWVFLRSTEENTRDFSVIFCTISSELTPKPSC